MISGPALRKACSENMIRSTAAAKPPPWRRRSARAGSARRCRATVACRPPPPRVRGPVGPPGSCANANGTTSSASAGAAVIPIATALWPLSTLTATSTAKIVRKQDSERISATNRPKRWLPARKPRAK